MVQAFSILHFSDEVFFTAVDTMDQYLAKSELNLCSDDLHPLAVASIFIASKLHDKNFIKLSKLVKLLSD